jgi:hypothetical protein
MFWLINKNGAYGARSGLVQVVKEIIIGLYKGKRVKKEENNDKKKLCHIMRTQRPNNAMWIY